VSLFINPKTWATNENLFAEQLNTLNAAIERAANSVVDAQIDAAAAIDGSKLLEFAITNSKLNDAAVTAAKFAVDATINVKAHVWSETITYDSTALPHTFQGNVFEKVELARATVTLGGRTVFVFGAVFGTRDDAGDGDLGLILTLRRAGPLGFGPFHDYRNLQSTGGPTTFGKRPLAITLMGSESGVVGANQIQFSINAQGNAQAADSAVIQAISFLVLEFT
jgi:hypothetical protein